MAEGEEEGNQVDLALGGRLASHKMHGSVSIDLLKVGLRSSQEKPLYDFSVLSHAGDVEGCAHLVILDINFGFEFSDQGFNSLIVALMRSVVKSTPVIVVWVLSVDIDTFSTDVGELGEVTCLTSYKELVFQVPREVAFRRVTSLAELRACARKAQYILRTL